VKNAQIVTIASDQPALWQLRRRIRRNRPA